MNSYSLLNYSLFTSSRAFEMLMPNILEMRLDDWERNQYRRLVNPSIVSTTGNTPSASLKNIEYDMACSMTAFSK